MAGEIIVGSVAVTVVPDMRGFNTRVRRELVPAATAIGKDIGRAISQGIIESLDFGDILTKVRNRSRTAIATSGRELGLSIGRAVRKGIDDSLKDIHANVNLDLNKASLDRVKAEARNITSRVNVELNTASVFRARAVLGSMMGGAGGGGINLGLGGGGGQQGPLDRALRGGRGGQSSFTNLLQGQQLLGLTQGFAALPLPAQIGAGGLIAAALPLIMQQLSGGIIAGLGTGLVGLGVAGAFGAGGTEQAAALAAQQRQIAAQDRVVAAQARLNTLRSSGKATTAQLASAEASLASARGTLATATDKVLDVRRISQQQQQLRTLFSQLGTNAQASLSQIGVSFIPVMRSIITTAEGTLGILTPVFAKAVSTISGPFRIFADTIVRSLGSPQVTSAIQAVAKAFGGILNALTPDLPGIINSFADAIERIANAVSKNPKAFADFINFLFQIVIFGLNAIAVLTDVADYVEFHFTPAVGHFVNFWIGVGHQIEHSWDVVWNNTIGRAERGFHEIAGVFDQGRHTTASRWNQLGRDVTNIWDSFWNNTIGRAIRGVERTLHVVDRILGVINTWDHLNSVSARIWNFIWANTIGWAITGTQQTISVIVRFVNWIISQWHNIQHWSSLIWNQIWANTIGQAISGYQRLLPVFRTIGNMVSGWWRAIMSASRAVWDQIWSNTIGQAIRGVQGLTRVFGTIRGLIINALNNSGQWLYNIGKDVIGGMFRGIYDAMKAVNNWVNTYVVQPIIHAVKWFFGIKSPSTVMMPVGGNIIRGMIQGMLTSSRNLLGPLMGKIFGGWPQALGSLVTKSLVDVAKLPAKALNALGSVMGKIGGFFAKFISGGGAGGVNQWAGVVMQALAMLHLPMSLLGQVLYQMQTESGGNPNAVNLTDINAQMGDPSRGLMQVIGGTFRAFHVPGTSGNILDPLANIAAALNYAMHVYGPTLMRGGMGVGSGHGYDAGGYVPPGASWFWNGTGRPEAVLTDSQWAAIYSAARGGDGAGVQYHAHFDGLTGAAIESHVQTAFQAMSMTQGALARQGRRS